MADWRADVRDMVRAALEWWAEPIGRNGIAARLALYAEPMRWARAIEREATKPEYAAIVDVGEAMIAVDGDVATAEPVYRTSPRGCERVRVDFGRSGDAWFIAEIESLGMAPIEARLPGLGPAYVAGIEAWAASVFAWSRETLRAHPPETGDPRMRAHAILALDEPLHLRSAPLLDATRDHLRACIDSVIAEVRTERVSDGATIWKLYDHGWIVKTARHCWAHDVYDGSGRAKMTAEQIDALLGEIEVLFGSHWHSDHIAEPVVRCAREKGIPVLAPRMPEGDVGDLLRARFADIEGITTIAPGTAGEIAGMPFRAFPGHQDELLNNAYVVAANGMTILHTGDQANEGDFAWIDRVGDEYRVDALLPNVWALDLPRLLKGVRARWIFPGHENEIGHLFEHREPFDQTYEKLAQVRDARWRVLAWGERIHIPPVAGKGEIR